MEEPFGWQRADELRSALINAPDDTRIEHARAYVRYIYDGTIKKPLSDAQIEEVAREVIASLPR